MLYLIRSNNYLKIGYTKDWCKRLKAYRTHNPDLEVLCVKEGERCDETLLHRLCKPWRYDLEWYDDSPYVIEIFNTVRKEENQP